MAKQYKALIGFSFKLGAGKPEKYVPAGETVTDLPAKVVTYLLAEQAIEEV